MPEEDVSDLRDVVDAINRLCDTMKTSTYDRDAEDVSPGEVPLDHSERVYPITTAQSGDWSSEDSCSTTAQYMVCSNEVSLSTEISLSTVAQYVDCSEDVSSRMGAQDENRSNNVSLSTSAQYLDCTDEMNSRTAPDYVDYSSENQNTEAQFVDCSNGSQSMVAQYVDTYNEIQETDDLSVQYVEYRDIELVSPEEIVVQKTEAYSAERWSDSTSLVSLPGQVDDVETVTSDTEPVQAQCEISEMYYTASSEVSLLSDTELPEKVVDDEKETKDDRRSVIAGHVAAMRERFESMTRTNTPCPDLIRSLSPSLEVFRNISPSPDRLA